MERRELLLGAALAPTLGISGRAIGKEIATPIMHNDIPFPDLPDQGPISEGGDAYAATALGLSRLAALTQRCALDIPYGDRPAQKLDLYLPADTRPGDRRPVMINIHGGAWRWGYKAWMGLNAPPITAAGAIYVSIGYTLAPAARHPAQLLECARALKWVHDNIGRYGGDSAHLVIGGHSAGAHLAALLTLRREVQANIGLPPRILKACVLASGAYDFRNPTLYGLPKQNRFLDDYLAHPQDAADASPIVWVSGNDVPFFVSWGGVDRDDARATGPAFAVALSANGGSVTTHLFPTFDHYWMHLAQQSAANQWTQAAIGFLKMR